MLANLSENMKKPGLKKVYVFFSSLFIFALHVPFVFAKSMVVDKSIANPPAKRIAVSDSTVLNQNTIAEPKFNLYDSLRLSSFGLARQAFDYAMKGFNYLKEIGTIENPTILSIVDFSEPSSQKRLFIIDIQNVKLLFNTYVAHGINSGKEFAKQFSNSMESNKSSLGFFETADTYNGKNGYSLHLQGLERGINNNAYKREIVMHGAEYVNEDMVRTRGYIGRSWGCPAVPENLHVSIIDKIKNGTCLFIFSPDHNYIKHSKILREACSPLLAYNNR
jgi:hypothetical protein